MNGLIVNYVLLLLFIMILIREITFIKKDGKVRPLMIVGTVVAIAMAVFSIIKGIPISQLKLEIENYFKK